jgi:hypothetical protein
MMLLSDFRRRLATAGKTFKDIQKLVKDVYGGKASKLTQIYLIINKAKEGKPGADP